MSEDVRAPGWVQRLTWAITGSQLGGAADEPDVDPVSGSQAALEAAGWDAVRVGDHAAARRSAAQPWPHPVPEGWVRPGEHARYQALVQELVGRLRDRAGQPTGGSGTPGPRDRQLMADRPPHW